MSDSFSQALSLSFEFISSGARLEGVIWEQQAQCGLGAMMKAMYRDVL